MHLFIVTYLKLLHGLLCLVYWVDSRATAIGNDISTIYSKDEIRESYGTNDRVKMLAPDEYRIQKVESSDKVATLTGVFKAYQKRHKRSAISKSTVAQRKPKDGDDEDAKRKQTLMSKITPLAFGNPSLPGQSKKGKKRPKPRKRNG